MAESDVAVAPPEISPADDQTQESAPTSEAAAEEVAPSFTVEEVEKETKETVEEVDKETKETVEEVDKETKETVEEVDKETKETVEEVEKETKDTVEEVEKETKDTVEVPVESENPAAGEETGQGNQDLKRKLEVQAETEKQLEETGNGDDGNEGEKEREGSESKRQKTETEGIEKSGEVQEEKPPVMENLEHDINTLEQTAEGDVQGDDFDTDKIETVDGSSETSRKIEVPNHRVGVLIGKAGDTIRNMQKLSGARIQIVKDAETAPDATTRAVELLGSVESIDKAEQLIRDVLAEADAGRPPPIYSRAFNTSQSSTIDVEIQVPNEKVGSIIGKGGQMIKDLQARSGAHILLLPTESSEGEDVKERTVQISGNKQQIEAAKHMIIDVVNQTARPPFQNRGGPGPRQSYGSRGPSSHGYGSQQWGPPRHQSHSPGFSKYPNQRGKNYPQQFPQNPRQNYGKYPPARSGGRGAGGRGAGMRSWDQRAPYGGNQPPQYGASGGPQYGQQQQAPYSYGAPNQYQQNAVPPQQSYQTPPSQQYYGQQGTQAGYLQQSYNTMYPQGQAAAGTYGAGATAQQQNPYAGQYGQAYSQPAGADGYAQQYSQQYPQQPGQVAAGYGQAAPAAYNQTMGTQGSMNYGYQGAVADPSAGYNAVASQAGYGQVMPATQAGYEQPVSQAGYDQGTVQPTAAGTTPQASGALVAGGQWQG